MFINEVITYGGAWQNLQEQFPEQLDSIRSVIASLTLERMAAQPLAPYVGKLSRLHWSQIEQAMINAMEDAGWDPAESRSQRGSNGLNLFGLGYIQDQVSLTFIRHRDGMNRWLYTVTPLALKFGMVRIPVALVIDDSDHASIVERISPNSMHLYGRVKTELQALAPLSNPTPFLILNLSINEVETHFFEISSDTDIDEGSIVINRAIEFPPEYRQAGIGILSYFGTVLEEKYPGNNARVRIEQDGLCVRLIVESDNGNREVIERALQEYEMVVRGDASPDSLFESKAKVVELQTELRIAQVRVDTQRDIISLQGEEIKTLRQLIGHSLSQSTPIAVNVSPTICLSNSVQVHHEVPALASHFQRLSDLAVAEPDIQLRLLDLEDAVASLGEKKTPEEAKGSSALRKLKVWLDDASSVGSATNTFLQKVGDGVELAQKVAKHYNSIAEWCGAPQVPKLFLGGE
ncbi:hypothetical protein [Herbaspirillum rubrisubalbicans]|uniref:hypothetical protein n=1 Tax=Herbaspirillum rubrisubalbicans TaxID=80842 RepID=UPI0002F4182E|nr:hypothetical protein [Herbaspirillum rubrisubalbicans]